MKLIACIAGISAGFMASLANAGQVTTKITLNGLNIDSAYDNAVTDPGTGAVFSNATATAGDGLFIIDYFNVYSKLPEITPGNILSTGGYVGNGGVSAPEDFGFTMTLPTPASAVNMIMDFTNPLGGSDSSALLQAFNASNQVIATDNVTGLTGFFNEQPLSVSVGSNSIVQVIFTPTDIGDNFGAISYTTIVPEPASLSLLAAAGLLLFRRRRFQRWVRTT